MTAPDTSTPRDGLKTARDKILAAMWGIEVGSNEHRCAGEAVDIIDRLLAADREARPAPASDELHTRAVMLNAIAEGWAVPEIARRTAADGDLPDAKVHAVAKAVIAASTPPAEAQPVEDPGPLLDSEGRAMVGASHHYTAENVRAIIDDLKECEQGKEVPEWVNRDHRGRCGVLWRVIAGLCDEVPLATPPASEARATGDAADIDKAVYELLTRVDAYGEACGHGDASECGSRRERVEEAIDRLIFTRATPARLAATGAAGEPQPREGDPIPYKLTLQFNTETRIVEGYFASDTLASLEASMLAAVPQADSGAAGGQGDSNG